MNGSNVRSVLFAAFLVSGFSGLVYESIWTHYLKLFLGHAAYAQTLVLAIFMGGMALGSAVCSRASDRWPDLLRRYAVVEGIIGVLAFAFHPLFVTSTDFAYADVLPALHSPTAVTLFKWALAAALILPQSTLLGMTFPLMTAGVLRKVPGDVGSTLAMLYFTNSIGAAIGVLVSGFWLTAAVGLPGTIAVAGALNVALAVLVWKIAGRDLPAPSPTRPTSAADVGLTWLLAFSALTGTASFCYEVGWIRMLSMVLGSSTHAFELMLSAFITGLAVGGLWVRGRIDGLANPERFLAWIQVAMGSLALATVPLYTQTFHAMQWLVANTPKTDQGYLLFNLGSHAIALAVMLPATFCAGTTLPLITYVLMRRGNGEGSIGAVYAANTVGAIVGVFGAVHLAMPLLGVKGVIVAGASVDLAVGIAILAWAKVDRNELVSAVVGAAVGLLVVGFGVPLEPYKMASGVFRSGVLLDPASMQVRYLADGKTATVSVLEYPNGARAIQTNGKTDAGAFVDGGPIHTEDELTMVLAGALPLAVMPEATSVANIGIGSGLTSTSSLAFGRVRTVDTIEIEPAMVTGARWFEPRVTPTFEDPRSTIHVEDAKTFFSTQQRTFDIIVSEPSNPWVSGVAGLFSREFYARARQNLPPNGLMVQWVQLYEIDVPLVVSVLKAVAVQFDDYALYATNRMDMLIVARPHGTLPDASPAALTDAQVAKNLGDLGVRGIDDLNVRWLGDAEVFGPMIEDWPIDANSDYWPVLDSGAAKARFLGASATAFVDPDLTRLPVAAMLSHHSPPYTPRDVAFNEYLTRSVTTSLAFVLRDRVLGVPRSWDHPEVPIPPNVEVYAEQARSAVAGCASPPPPGPWFDGMFNTVAKRVVPALASDDLAPVWAQVRSDACWAQLDDVQQTFVTLLEAVGRRDGAAMARSADALLALPGLPPDLLDYCLSASVLGHLAQGDAAGAGQALDAHGPSLPPEVASSLRWTVLRAHAAR